MKQEGRASGIRGAVVAFLVVVVVVVAALLVVLVLRPPFAQPLFDRIDAMQLSSGAAGSSASREGERAESFASLADAAPTEAERAAEEEEWKRNHVTPYIARCGDLMLHSSITPADLTGILFHQASYNYALPFETELPEADYETVASNRSMRINHDQVTGEWLDAEALHLWRTTDATAMETSIDEGGLAGTSVRAPVSGTVVLVRDYMLYDEVPDIEIHIQPDGHADLDCVLIHTTDPAVKAGDHVDGGITEICKVRDIEKDLTDVQLYFFTPEGVGGNHVHVQVNDANYEGYRKEKLKGAVKVA